MKRWWRKLRCYFGKHEMTTVVLVNEKDEICRGHFCLFCDTYKLINEVHDEQIIPAEETDPD